MVNLNLTPKYYTYIFLENLQIILYRKNSIVDNSMVIFFNYAANKLSLKTVLKINNYDKRKYFVNR